MNAGSRTAAEAGLYHFTTDATLGSKEATSTNDIGFHYVSTDLNGVVSDEDDDGVSNYLEDEDGDGALESGETSFLSATDSGLRIFITEPKASSTIP